MRTSEYSQEIWDPRPHRIIRELIEEAIQPFRPGLITMWVEQDLDFRRTKICIECTTFEDEVAVIEGQELYLLAPEYMAVEVGEQAGAYFASLMNESVPDTVVLGEN